MEILRCKFFFLGFEFDVGIHYIGNITGQSMNRVLTDQITDGQLDWVPLEDVFDTVVIGDLEKDPRKFPIVGTGPDEFKKTLIKHFPKEEKGINSFMALLKVSLANFSCTFYCVCMYILLFLLQSFL